MRTRVRDTSIASYDALKASPQLGRQQQRILAVLAQHRDLTRGELARASEIPINAVCGRVKELIDAGVIEEFGQRWVADTNRFAHTLRVVPKQLELV